MRLGNASWINETRKKVRRNDQQSSKCPSLLGFTHWVNPGKPGLGFTLCFGKKSGGYWVIKYFKCLDVKNCANLWILRQVK